MVLSSVNHRHLEGLRGLVSAEKQFLCLPARNVNCPYFVRMASPLSTPSPTKRGEVDTSKPYTDVREAILRFDHPVVSKGSSEKRAFESPVIGNLKEQLAEAVAAKEKVESDKLKLEQELDELKVSYQEVTRKLEQAFSSPSAVEDGDDRELRGLYAELQVSKSWVERLEAEIAESDLAAEAAVKQTEQAEASATMALQNLEIMSKDLQTAARTHEEDRAKVVAGESLVESLNNELTVVKHQEQELRGEVTRLKDIVVELSAELDKAKEELAELKGSEAKSLAFLGETTAQIKVLEVQLKQVEDEKTTLLATTRYLEPELESTKAELEDLRTDNASDGVVEKYKAKVDVAKSSQVKVDETVSGVLDGLEQVLAEAIEAKAVKEAVDGEIQKMRDETVELKMVAEIAEKKAEEVLKEIESSKASEGQAAEAMKSLVVSGDVEDEQQVARIHVLEDLTNKKIDDVDAEVEAIKVREMEMKKSLEEARAEIEASKMFVKQANEKAASAEAAKSAVEGELRRWRSENEQRRKNAQAQALAMVAHQNGMGSFVGVKSGGGGLSLSDHVRKADEEDLLTGFTGGRRLSHQGESLAQVLQMKVPGKASDQQQQQQQQQLEELQQQQRAQVVEMAKTKKKLKLLARLSAVFSPKKKK